MKISIQKYAQALFELTDGKSQKEILDVIKKFSEVLKREGMIRNIKKIIEKFEEIYNKKNGIIMANIISSRKLSDEHIFQVENFIKNKYKTEKVEIENSIDKKIKGGIIIKIGDEVIDGSVAIQIKKMKEILIS